MSAKRGSNNSKYNNELIDCIASVRRVTKVVKGGSRFSFSVLVIVGDRKGHVGYGSAKDKELNEAKMKALKVAKRSLIHVPLRSGRTIHHDIISKYSASKVLLKSAKIGTGVIAGGAMRDVFECLGIKDIVAKSLGSSHPYSVVVATINALRSISTPKQIADKRAVKVGFLLSRRNNI